MSGFLRPAGEPTPEELTERGLELMVEQIQADLELLGVRFDRWFRERTLYEGADGLEPAYEAAMQRLREGSFIVENEGAIWFASKKLGEDKDNVLVRRSGEPTYFASDVAYHFDKFVRAEVRPCDQRLGSGPPRTRLAGQGSGGGRGRAAGRTGDRAVPAGAPEAGRRAGADVEADGGRSSRCAN